MVSSSDEICVRRKKRSRSYERDKSNRRKKYINAANDNDELQHHSKWDSPERERRKQRSRSNEKDKALARERHRGGDREYEQHKHQHQHQHQQQQQQQQQHTRLTRRIDEEEYSKEKTRYDNKLDANYSRNNDEHRHSKDNNNRYNNRNRHERSNYERDNNNKQQQQRHYEHRDTNRENKQNKRYQRRYSTEKHEKSYDWGKKTETTTHKSNAGGGGGDGTSSKTNQTTSSIDKEKPNFGLSGALTEDTNKVNGIVIKYSEPPEARKPKRRWRLYPFKGETPLPTLHIHRQSCFLVGRDRKVVDLAVDHPSCSKQHAALQYRLVSFERLDGTTGKRVRPYLIDLESANGTFLNNKKIEARKYYELIEKDVIKFGFSTREYVLLHENSKEDQEDDDVFIKSEVKVEAEDETDGPNP